MTYQLGFIGAGNMAEAIATAAIKQGVLTADAVIAADPTEARRDVFAKLGVAVTDRNEDVLRQSEQVVLAVKPQMFDSVAADLAVHAPVSEGRSEQVLISIMAGITSPRLAEAVNIHREGAPAAWRVIRVMPNTPMLVGQGMAGIARGNDASAGDEDLAVKLFSAGGKAVVVDEPAIDAITAVSGSGPAYLFYLAEAMEEAARKLGLQDHAALLVQQTLYGAATLLGESEDDAAMLRRKVTSPGGTTEAAIKHMDGNSTQAVVINAIKAAHARSIELGKG